MTKVEIQETIVTPDGAGVCVQLHISDVPKNSENATLTIVILAKLPRPKTQILEGLQLAAAEKAWQVLHQMQTELYQQVPAQAQSFLRQN